jgi:hypothetical protein
LGRWPRSALPPARYKKQRISFSCADEVRAGGDGTVEIADSGTIYRYSGNFLLPTRPLWTMCGYLFASVKAGNIAIIFSVKTRAWRERMTPDRPIPGVDPASNSQMILILPDNNRDPELTEVLRKAQEKYFARKQQR